MDTTLTAFARYKEKAKEKRTQSHIQKENEEKSDGLGQAKDRAQLTATSAMSVVQIALLKEVILLGPKYNRYYIFTMVLICASLALQIISGLIALLVGHIRLYYSQYEDDALDDCCQHLCCCGCVCRHKADKEALRINKHGLSNNTFDGENNGNGTTEEKKDKGLEAASENEFELENMPEHSHIHVDSEVEQDVRTHKGCCPCKITTMIFDQYEHNILNSYEDWKTKVTEFETEAAESNIQMRYLAEEVKSARQRHTHLIANKDNYTPEEFSKRTDEIQALLDRAQRKREHLEVLERKAMIARARGDVLWEKAKSIRRYQVLKRSSFWQNTINYIYYCVFVLNAFITGFGVMSTEQNVVSVPLNGTAT